MSTKCPEILTADNVSHGWGKVLLRVLERGSSSLQPILLSIELNDVMEDNAIRAALDAELARYQKHSCSESAMTIFPFKQWLRNPDRPREALFDWYLSEFLPRLKARGPLNRNGTYFERMIRATGSKSVDGKLKRRSKNQLDHILKIWQRDRAKRSRPRRSALQVSCFDPIKDHTGQKLRGFPCLQQVSFDYDDAGGLAVSAYYPTQYVFDRGYGNYLGLAYLGRFMAHEAGLRLIRLNCFILRPELGRNMTKAKLRALSDIVKQQIQRAAAVSGH